MLANADGKGAMGRTFLTCFILVAGALLVVGCGPTALATATPTPSPGFDPASDSNTQQPQELIMSDALKRGCGDNRNQGGFQNAGLPQGETAVDFTLRDTEGNPFTLSELLSEKPVVMVFGSFT